LLFTFGGVGAGVIVVGTAHRGSSVRVIRYLHHEQIRVLCLFWVAPDGGERVVLSRLIVLSSADPSHLAVTILHKPLDSLAPLELLPKN
jgi:hypothetical protein